MKKKEKISVHLSNVFVLQIKRLCVSIQNALTFKVKRTCVSSKTYLRLKANALAFFYTYLIKHKKRGIHHPMHPSFYLIKANF